MPDLLVVLDPRRVVCPVCERLISLSAVEKALERGWFYCTGVHVKTISSYTIDEQVLA